MCFLTQRKENKVANHLILKQGGFPGLSQHSHRSPSKWTREADEVRVVPHEKDFTHCCWLWRQTEGQEQEHRRPLEAETGGRLVLPHSLYTGKRPCWYLDCGPQHTVPTSDLPEPCVALYQFVVTCYSSNRKLMTTLFSGSVTAHPLVRPRSLTLRGGSYPHLSFVSDLSQVHSTHSAGTWAGTRALHSHRVVWLFPAKRTSLFTLRSKWSPICQNRGLPTFVSNLSVNLFLLI